MRRKDFVWIAGVAVVVMVTLLVCEEALFQPLSPPGAQVQPEQNKLRLSRGTGLGHVQGQGPESQDAGSFMQCHLASHREHWHWDTRVWSLGIEHRRPEAGSAEHTVLRTQSRDVAGGAQL